MNSSKDFCLVPAELISKISSFLDSKQNYAQTSKLAEIDSKMASVLESDEALENKIYKYNQILRDYIDEKSKLANIKRTYTEPTKKSDNVIHTDLKNKTLEQYASNKSKNIATSIINTINQEKNKDKLTFDKNTGEAVYYGTKLDDTNLTDIIDFLQDPKKKNIPPNMGKVYEVLQDLNFPRDIMSDNTRSKIERLISANKRDKNKAHEM